MFPFIYIIEQIFLLSYQLTGNYGTAVILLSFAISLLLLPVFIFIERAKKKDDAVKLKIKPLIDEIKRVYKGQERYYYIRTINRQHKYSSARALIPILTLLLQIPFFIAAYQYLEGFEPLKGTSFLFIKDLSLPDGLFGSIHFLPIFMTLVNLLTAYFYTRNGNTSERKQMLVVAGIFLILLFNLPSGLVLYWTMNNVFSFFRLFITNPEVFKKKERRIDYSEFINKFKLQLPWLKKVFIIIVIGSIISQINWAYSNNFDEINLRLSAAVFASIIFSFLLGLFRVLYDVYLKKLILQIEIKAYVYISLIFLTFYFYSASQNFYSGENQNLLIISLLILIPTQFIGLVKVYQKRESLNKIITFFIILITIFQFINLFVILGDPISIRITGIDINVSGNGLSDIIFAGLIVISISSISILKPLINQAGKKSKKKVFVLFVLAVFYISSMLFIWNPLIVFSSSPDSFSFLAFDIIKTNISLFLILFLGSIILFWILPYKIKYFVLLTILVISITFFINSSIIPLDVGTLQMHRFSDIFNLEKPLWYFFLEALFILGLILFVNNKLQKTRLLQIGFILVLINLITVSHSLYLSIDSGKILKYSSSDKQKEIIIKDSDRVKKVTFSENKQNVLVIILDMVQGWYLRSILVDNPDYFQTFSGFTWYPNTVSITNYTASSAPSILAGFDYTPDKLDIDSTRTLKEKIDLTFKLLYKKAQNSGYSFISSKIPSHNTDQSNIDEYLPHWDSKWDYLKPQLKIGEAKEQEYSLLWQNALFFSVPLFIKSKIYKRGSWLFKKSSLNENTSVTKHYNFLRVLPYISEVKNTKPSFIFIWSASTHFPWDIIDDEGVFKPDVTPYENNQWGISKVAEWIEWMKRKNVYDNTKIIILSDHGIRDTEINDTVMIENPFIPTEPENVSLKEALYFTPLMMVKDYNAKGDLDEDWRFLSNADTYSIAFDENDPTKADPPFERELEVFKVSWKIKAHKDFKIPIISKYRIKENVYEFKNWKKFK